MKWKIISAGIGLILLLGSAHSIRACEVCGCTSGINALGILPQFNNHFIGLRYSYRQFHTIHPPSIIPGQTGQVSDEYFHSLELWGRFYPTKRLQVFTFVPFLFYRQQSVSEGNVEVNTIGDVSVMANYIIIKAPDSTQRKARHSLQAGLGVKMPTGRYDLKNGTELLNPNLQPGTGSWDFTANVSYTVRWNAFGLNNEALYRLNTTNGAGYKFGDKITLASRAFYWKKWKKWSLMPSTGVQYEYTFANMDHNSRVSYTGGNLLAVHAGLDVYWDRFSVGVSTQVPCWQNVSDGYVQNMPRANAQFIVMF